MEQSAWKERHGGSGIVGQSGGWCGPRKWEQGAGSDWTYTLLLRIARKMMLDGDDDVLDTEMTVS